MTAYRIRESTTSDNNKARRGRVVHLSEPTEVMIMRALRVHAQRARNYALTPPERIEASECLASLLAQLRAATGRRMMVTA